MSVFLWQDMLFPIGTNAMLEFQIAEQQGDNLLLNKKPPLTYIYAEQPWDV